MPFSNITGDPNDAWIGAGIAETLMADLQRAHGFTVIDPEFVTEAMNAMGLTARASNGEAALLAVARRVGAQRMITGGYQRLGDQIRITGRLVEVQTRLVARAAKVDGALGELFGLQDQIVGELVNGTSAMADLTPEPVPVPPPAVSTVAEPSPVEPVDSPSTGEAGGVATLSAINTGGAALLAMIDGPPPPVAPEVVNRDEAGRATIRAIKLTQGIRVDGRLDEQVYHVVPPITDFVQQMPDEGAAATEKTEAWIMFDERTIYVAGRVWDSAPPSEWVANEMRRDAGQLLQNDMFGVFFDTFYDRRNGFNFSTSPLGALADQQFTNEGNPNMDWNPVWDVRTGRFEGGWTVEMEIPFKSLRYRSGPLQVWGVQLRRGIRRKNEKSYLTPIPISAGVAGIFRVSAAATLVGLEVPDGGMNLEIKPYGIGGVRSDLTADPPVRDEGNGDLGVDVKFGLSRSLTADLTYNTDFAQVEVDEQQVNLTRFSLFFPEKREFFLEGQGIFRFARGGYSRGSGGGRGRRGGGDVPTIFFSRRIGLQDGAVVPILGGGRVTGKVGAFDVGALSVQADELGSDVESTNFTAVRLRRDVLRRSSIGAIFTNRSVSLVGDGSSQAYGVDGLFSFYDNVEVITYVAKTETPGLRGRDMSYQGRFSYNGDRYGLIADHLVVEDHFTPEVGFVRRDNFRQTNLSGRFSPRPRSIEWVRQFAFEGRVDYFLTADTGRLETRLRVALFDMEFENSDRFRASFIDSYELLEEPFEIAPDVTIPVGGHSFSDIEASYTLGVQRRASGRFSVRVGSFWSGDIKAVGFTRGRVEILEQFSLEPSVSVNWIDLPEGSFRTELARLRLSYSFTPRMFFSGLVQYNSNNDSLSTNLRLRWEYSPGSELFIVYTDDRDTDSLLPNRFSELSNHGFVVKVTRLFRF